jgi:ABC-type uncharacterized transport system ATPase subunit
VSGEQEGRVLELDGLTRRFGPVTALDGLSFTVRPGQLFGFVGSNGAGKTTAMRIVMGIDDPDAGEVRFGRQRLTPARRERFGYMPEERGLYPKVPARRQLVYLGRLHGMSRAAATLGGLVPLTARVYRGGVLRTAKVSLREALRAGRNGRNGR